MVIFDTPARLDEATSKAISLSDLVIIPAKATMKDIERIGASSDLILKTSETPSFVVLNQVRPQGDREGQARDFLRAKQLLLCPHSFGNRVAFEDADTTGQTPQETEPSGKAAQEISQVYKFTISLVNKITKERMSHEELSQSLRNAG